MFSYKQINIVKENIKIGYIQSFNVSYVRKNEYLNMPFPLNVFAEEVELKRNRWERLIEAECNRFVISLKDINDFDRFSLLENLGIDFKFDVEILNGECSYNKDGYMTHLGNLNSVWKEKGFRFQKPISEFYVNNVLYQLDFVNIIKDFSRPVNGLLEKNTFF